MRLRDLFDREDRRCLSIKTADQAVKGPLYVKPKQRRRNGGPVIIPFPRPLKPAA
jgi:hypothetical protein